MRCFYQDGFEISNHSAHQAGGKVVREGADDCGIDLKNTEDLDNMEKLFNPEQIIIIDITEKDGDAGVMLQIGLFAVYHEEPLLASSSLNINNSGVTVNSFKAVPFKVLLDCITDSIMIGLLGKHLGVEVHTLEQYHKKLPLAEIISGCVFGVIFIIICILSAIKAVR